MCFTLYCMYCSYLYIYVRSMVNVSLFNNLGILNPIAYSIKKRHLYTSMYQTENRMSYMQI